MHATPNSGSVVGPKKIVRRIGLSLVPKFSICTMVTRWSEYQGLLDSLADHGFDEHCCEYLFVDNSEFNAADAYVSLNEFLQAADGKYIIICHQDVLLLEMGKQEVDDAIVELHNIDPHWAICGNAGHTHDGWPAISISHPFKEKEIEGAPFPARVVSLDENLIIVRKDANLALSRDLSGFHHYAADLCIIADVLGWNCYVIDFFIRHNSAGVLDKLYYESRSAIAKKYNRAFRPRWLHIITEQPFYLSGDAFRAFLAKTLRLLLRRLKILPAHEDLRNPIKRARRDASYQRR